MMGGVQFNTLDPRRRPSAHEADQQTPKQEEPEAKRPILTTQIANMEHGPTGLPVQPYHLTPVSKEASPSVESDRSYISSHEVKKLRACVAESTEESKQLRACIAARDAENCILAKEKADALQKCADIQKQHEAAESKYCDIHARYENVNNLRLQLLEQLRKLEESANRRNERKDIEKLDLEKSCAKRVSERDNEIKEKRALVKEISELQQACAAAAQENSSLRSENLELMNTIVPHETRIKDLEAEITELKKPAENYHAITLEQYNAVRMERDALRKEIYSIMMEKDGLQDQINTLNQTRPGGNDRKRGRSRSPSRSAPKEHDRDHSSARPMYREDRYDARDRGRSRTKSGSRFRSRRFHPLESQDIYRPDPSASHPPAHGREPSRPAGQRELYHLPDTTTAPNGGADTDLPVGALTGPRATEKQSTSKETQPAGISRGTKAEALFSLGGTKKKAHSKGPGGGRKSNIS